MASVSPNHQIREKGKPVPSLDRRQISESERDLILTAGVKLIASRLGIGCSTAYKLITPKADLLPGEEFETERRSYALSFVTELEVAVKTGHEDKARELLQSIASAFGWDVVDECVLQRERKAAVEEFSALVASEALPRVQERREWIAKQGELFTDSSAGPRGLALAGDQ